MLPMSFDEPAHHFLISLKNTTEQTAPRVGKKVGKFCTLHRINGLSNKFCV